MPGQWRSSPAKDDCACAGGTAGSPAGTGRSLNMGTTTVGAPVTRADVSTPQRVTCSPGEGEVLEPSARDR